MKRMILTASAAVACFVAANAQVSDAAAADSVIPSLLECYIENVPLEDAQQTFIPQELTEYSLIPDGINDVELNLDVEGDISEEEVMQALSNLQGDLADYARKFIGTRYVWGAKGPKAFDCSGFTGYVFRNFGYDIGQSSRVQATRGEKVDIKEARVGDLMFFSRPKGGKTVGHVGMVIDVDADNGSLKFIHASTKKGVTIQKFPDTGHYNKRFLQVRRVIDEKNLG